MNLQALLIRSTVLMVVAFILAVSATYRIPSAHAQAAANSAAPTVATDTRPVVELPTISVRPSAADLLEAQRESSEASDSGELINAAATDALYQTLTPELPSLRMDMPYYSFGKALRHGVKE